MYSSGAGAKSVGVRAENVCADLESSVALGRYSGEQGKFLIDGHHAVGKVDDIAAHWPWLSRYGTSDQSRA
jgi:hypothetical protein